MLSSRHFDEFASDKDNLAWEGLVKSQTVVQCKNCGKWVWSRWHSEKNFIDQCAKCYFNDK